MSRDPITDAYIDALLLEGDIHEAVYGSTPLDIETDLLREGVFLYPLND
ncbi:hypothetical protein ACUDTL_16710 [Stenotrophomonas pavanii]